MAGIIVILLMCGALTAVLPGAVIAQEDLHGGSQRGVPAVTTIPGGVIELEKVDGLAGDGEVTAGQPITFHLRFTNRTGKTVAGFSNGFRVYSPDGATWGDMTADSTGGLSRAAMDGGVFFLSFSVDGAGADTIGLGGFRIMNDGMVNEWSGVAFTITIGPIDPAMAGRKVCLDKSFFPPGGAWLWSLEETSDNVPDWGGPYCFTIVK